MGRESGIVEMVETYRYMDTDMIISQAFRFPSGTTKARQVLARMTNKKLINRFRLNSREPYIYHTGPRSAKWRHWLELSRFHFSLLAELKSWQKILFWQHEVKYDGGIADGFYVVKTTIDGSGVMFYLEVDDGANKFDKVQKYEAYFKSMKWRSEWWGKNNGHPMVLIVTPRNREIGMMAKGYDWVKVTGKMPGGYLKFLVL